MNRPGRKRTLSVLVASALMVLTGCGTMHPGSAVAIGSATISHDTVEKVARALCSANLGGAEARGEAAPVLPTKGARLGALQILVDSELSRLFGESVGVEPDNQQVSASLEQNEAGIALLPESQRGDFRAALKAYAEGQLMLIAAGRQSLEGQGQVTDEEALAEGQRLRKKFVADLDIDVDPRYGTFKDNSVQPADAGLSVPVSDGAVAAGQAQPAPSWVTTLPASQKCG